jgi:hypothetical protein
LRCFSPRFSWSLSGQVASLSRHPIQSTLFNIGGGARLPELLQALIAVSGIADSGSAVIWPMAGADTSAYYVIRQFADPGNLALKRCADQAQETNK